MQLSRKITFERICGAYLMISIAIAMIIPSNFSVEAHLSLPIDCIPFANYISHLPGRIESASLYFVLMWLLIPLVVALFAIRPQVNEAQIPASRSATKALLATLVAFAILALVGSTFYLDASAFRGSSHGIALFLLMARHKLGLGVLGGILMLTTAIAINMAFIQIPRVWVAYVSSIR
jgi:hypothetical protein